MAVKLRVIRPLLLIGICLLALSPVVAHASQTYVERVAAIETGIGHCTDGSDASSFAGSAFGTLNGTFDATICHTPLSPNATIVPGGSFALSNQSTVVSGQFTGGAVTFIREGHFGAVCFQLFQVTGGLGPDSTHTTGSFAAVLTHYGIWDGTACHVGFATVVGRATVSL